MIDISLETLLVWAIKVLVVIAAAAVIWYLEDVSGKQL